MFKSGQTNPYDDIVNKTTDENLTSENWELILNLCDKVQDEGQEGAHSVIAAVLKRLAHRNPNVQLYALSLAEALSKNCGIELHREIASRAFTQGLEKIITDRMTHEKVKRRALGLIAMWTAEFANDSTLGVMEDCYNSLKAKNYKFEAPQEAPPPAVDDEVRRREEEELQRVLEMSMQDKGGRDRWNAYSTASSSGAAGSSSSASASKAPVPSSSSSSMPPPSSAASSKNAFAPPVYQAGGYVPARTPPPKAQSPVTSPAPAPAVYVPAPAPVEPTPTRTIPSAIPAASVAPAASEPSVTATTTETTAATLSVVTRVRALHTFEPTEAGELAFEKGDIIKVVDRGYKDWWRGQLKGRTGIFPVNYVEPMPEQTAAELAKEAEQEAAVFAQAANVDRLLTMLRSLDPAKDNLADNEEIQELYRSSMALRPKIVKLIDKYSQKRADLVSMNETFVRARNIFDQMMEESLANLAARTGVYESQPTFRAPQYQAPEARGRSDYVGSPAPKGYVWNAAYDQPGYFPTPATGYPDAAYAGPSSPYMDPAAYAAMQQKQAAYAQAYVSAAYGPQGPTPYPQQPTQQDAAAVPLVQQQLAAQPQAQIQPQQQSHPLPQAQAQAQPQVQPQPQVQSQVPVQAQTVQAQQPLPGPPYVFDPNGTYADPNVQAWASYYAQGGKELTGAVYFISIPGLTDVAAPAGVSSPTVSAQSPQQQLQHHMQQQQLQDQYQQQQPQQQQQRPQDQYQQRPQQDQFQQQLAQDQFQQQPQQQQQQPQQQQQQQQLPDPYQQQQPQDPYQQQQPQDPYQQQQPQDPYQQQQQPQSQQHQHQQAQQSSPLQQQQLPQQLQPQSHSPTQGQVNVGQVGQNELPGYAVPQSQPGSQLPLSLQVNTSLQANGYAAVARGPSYATGAAAPATWSRSSPPTSPGQANPMSAYPQHSTSDASNYINQNATPSYAIPQSQASQTQLSYLPSPGSYADPLGRSASTQVAPSQVTSLRRATSLGGGQSVSQNADMNLAGRYSQYYGLPNQLAGMVVGEESGESEPVGQQPVLQAPQGVGAPA